MWVCMCVGVYVSTIKRKPLIGMTGNFCTVVILDRITKPTDFGFKRSGADGPLACIFSDWCRTPDEEPLPLPIFIYAATLPFESVCICISVECTFQLTYMRILKWNVTISLMSSNVLRSSILRIAKAHFVAYFPLFELGNLKRYRK